MVSATKVYVVTGANSGLGKDASRQLALLPDTKVVYLACRSKDKAMVAIDDLVNNFNVSKSKLAYIHFDSSDNKESIERDADSLPEGLFIDGFIMNAGGFGPDNHAKPTSPENNGVTSIAQVNLIGHVHYMNRLLATNKLGTTTTSEQNDNGGPTTRSKKKSHVVYSGSEAARGVSLMGMKPPMLEKYSDQDFSDMLTGKFYEKKYDKNAAYGEIKGIAALYLSEFARRHPEIYVLTISPGGTVGTNFKDATSISPMERIMFGVFMNVLKKFGKFHDLHVGAKRYVDGVVSGGEFDKTKKYESGTFLASKKGVNGIIIDQAQYKYGKAYGNRQTQLAAYNAVVAHS